MQKRVEVTRRARRASYWTLGVEMVRSVHEGCARLANGAVSGGPAAT